MAHVSRAQRRQTVDAVVIVTGVALLGLAVWGGTLGSAAKTAETRLPHVPWIAHFLAGAAAILGVGTVQKRRWRRPGHGLLALAALILLGTLIVFHAVGLWAWLSLILPAAVLLGAMPLVGPMPVPEE